MLITGCTTQPAEAHDPPGTVTPAESTKTTMEPHVSDDSFTPGPAVADAKALLAWFEGEGKGKKVRIPVIINPSPLGLSSGYIAANTAVAEADGLLIKLDDGRLGVSLADRVRPDCDAGVPCAVWIEGIWGAVVSTGPSLGGPGPGPSLGGPSFGPTKHPFSVHGYKGKVEGDAANVLISG